MADEPLETVQPIVRQADPLGLIAMAIEKGMDPDRMTKLYDLHERHEKDKSLKAYQRAMNACQEEMPAILKDKQNLHTKSKYPDLGAIIHKIKPVYTKHGFSLSFHEGETPKAGFLRCICDVMHVDGHREMKWMDLPIDGTGAKGGATAMNPLQGVGSTHTYGERYLTCKIFNLPVAETDLDGNNGATISDESVQWADQALNDCRADRGKFFKWAGVSSLEEITQAKWPVVRDMLSKKLKDAEAAI